MYLGQLVKVKISRSHPKKFSRFARNHPPPVRPADAQAKFMAGALIGGRAGLTHLSSFDALRTAAARRPLVTWWRYTYRRAYVFFLIQRSSSALDERRRPSVVRCSSCILGLYYCLTLVLTFLLRLFIPNSIFPPPLSSAARTYFIIH